MIPRQNTNIIIFISPADTPLTRRGRGASCYTGVGQHNGTKKARRARHGRHGGINRAD